MTHHRYNVKQACHLAYKYEYIENTCLQQRVLVGLQCDSTQWLPYVGITQALRASQAIPTYFQIGDGLRVEHSCQDHRHNERRGYSCTDHTLSCACLKA